MDIFAEIPTSKKQGAQVSLARFQAPEGALIDQTNGNHSSITFNRPYGPGRFRAGRMAHHSNYGRVHQFHDHSEL